jgi:hypothetical protein
MTKYHPDLIEREFEKSRDRSRERHFAQVARRSEVRSKVHTILSGVGIAVVIMILLVGLRLAMGEGIV